MEKTNEEYTEEELAYIHGIELAIDWNLPITLQDLEQYHFLINKNK